MATGTFDNEIRDAMMSKSGAKAPPPSHSINQSNLKGHRPAPKQAASHNPNAVATTPPPPHQHQTAGGQPMLSGNQMGDPNMGDLARAHATIVSHLASRM